MARARTSVLGRPGWLRHQRLVAIEAALLVAVGMELAQRYIAGHQQVPWWLKTLEVMAVNAGMLGGLVVALAAWTKGSLSRAVQTLPAPLLLVHAAVLAGIFLLYARIWGFLA